MGAGLSESWRLGVIVALAIVGSGLRRRHGEELAGEREVCDAAAVGEEPVMADAVSARTVFASVRIRPINARKITLYLKSLFVSVPCRSRQSGL